MFGQGNSCSSATALVANGIFTCPAITSGTYQQVCFATVQGINSKWYKFAPTANGQVSISSNLPVNQDVDTRLSVMSGSCGTLTCVAANDNVNPNSFTNRLSSVFLAVQAGTTYYIQWDSRNDNRSFQFEYSFTANTCLPINQFAVYDPLYATSNEATLKWLNALGNPENYRVEWNNDFLPEQSPNNTSVVFTADNGASSIKTIDNLPAGANISYFISSVCGSAPNYTGQSSRRGPYNAFLAKNLPYSLTFEEEFPMEVFNDGFIGFNLFLTNDLTEPANYADGGAGRAAVTANSTQEFSNLWGYSRAINLVAGQQVTISFKSRLFSFSGTPSPMSLELKAGLSQNQSAQLNDIASFNLVSSDNYTTHSATFIAPATDVYYFGFHNNSFPGSNQTFAFFDTFNFTTTLSNPDYQRSGFSILPNPAHEFIKFSGTDVEITAVQIVDMNGRMIKHIDTFNSNDQIDISELSKGVYLVRITTENDQWNQKFLKI